jgi:addiction module HigA family antidote
MKLTPYRLAKAIHVPPTRIAEILAGRRAITADTGLRLDRYFSLSEGYWIGLQTDYDVRRMKSALAAELEAILPLRVAVA